MNRLSYLLQTEKFMADLANGNFATIKEAQEKARSIYADSLKHVEDIKEDTDEGSTKLADLACSMLNRGQLNGKVFVTELINNQHKTLQQHFFDEVIQSWVYGYSKTENYDPRSECAVKIARKMYKAIVE